MNSLEINGPTPKRYRIAGSRAVLELSLSTTPTMYTRTGHIEHQDTPKNLGVLGRVLWCWYKLRSGWRRCAGGVYRVQAEHEWWGLAVFEAIKKHIGLDAFVIICESNEIYSLCVVTGGRLIAYEVFDEMPGLLGRVAKLATKEYVVCAPSQQYQIVSQELTRSSNDVRVVPLVLRMGRCDLFEEFVAWRILSQRSTRRRDMIQLGVMVLLSLDVLRLAIDRNSLVHKSVLLEMQVEKLKKHPLYSKNLPVACPYHTLLPVLTERYDWVQLCNTTVKLRTCDPLKSARLLRRLGIAVKARNIDLLGTSEMCVEGCWREPSDV